ncbi:ankyrin repeat domain-containing protein SOWAHC [Labrus mixtus]|uniref:ankyrin repeat domain-containing protein SOWAHC n=1 Tax=Labrus mixtus TaxID=508554 RepID=UPI0029C0E8AA|nr:ankyrin repeat domain-containing protein SOWAHC [Labrus mixtus]
MDTDFNQSPCEDQVQVSGPEEIQDSLHDQHSQTLPSDVNQDQVLDKTEEEVEYQKPPQDQLGEQEVLQSPSEELCEESELYKVNVEQSIRELDQDQDQVSQQNLDQDQAGLQQSLDLDQDQDQAGCKQHLDQNQDRTGLHEHLDLNQDQAELQEHLDHDGDQDRGGLKEHLDLVQDRAGLQEDLNQDRDPAGLQENLDQDQDLQATDESGGSVPELVITQAEERPSSAAGPPESPVKPADPLRQPAGQVSCSSEGGDAACCDRLSMRSDSISLSSERTTSRMSEEDDSRSVAASSFMSLFHRVQLDPLEREWLKSSAVGNMAAQKRLLAQEPSLVMKKTALHWAAKQGCQEAVDVMLCSGADVNARSVSGYTALHLASIHGHQHVVHALIYTYKAKTSLRDYHGKMPDQYWSGCTEVFTKQDPHSGARFSRGRWTQRYALSSLLLSHSRSQSQINMDFGTQPPSSSQEVFELQL